MKTLSITLAFIAILVGVSCSNPETGSITTAQQNEQHDQRLLLVQSIPNMQGSHSIYYRGDLVKVVMSRITKAASALLIENGAPISKIFATVESSQPQTFKFVLDTIIDRDLNQYNMLHVIEFNEGITPRQFYAASEIEAAMNAGEITVTNTEIVYNCIFI